MGPRAAYWIIFVHGISSFCLGMVFPFTAIYLSDLPGVGPTGVALYYLLSGAANLAVAVLLATGTVRPPRVPLAITGTLLCCAGFLLLATAGGLPSVAAAGASTGAGMGCFLAAIIPIINSLVAEADRRRVFARRYQVLNATLAGGSLVAGLLIVVLSRDAIRYLIVGNAIGWLPVALTLWWHRAAARAGEEAARAASGPGDATAGDRPMPLRLLLRASLAVALFQLGVYLFGYSQFEVTMPLVSDELLRISLAWVSVLIAVNVGVIVAAQSWVTRVLASRPEVVGLRVAVALWVGGFVLAGATALAPTPVAVAGLVGYAILFALGECAYSCSYHPWLISRVPDAELTRANALSNSMMGIGLFAGPSLGVALVATGNAAAVWLVLAVACSTVGLATRQWRRPPPPSPPTPAEESTHRDPAPAA